MLNKYIDKYSTGHVTQSTEDELKRNFILTAAWP